MTGPSNIDGLYGPLALSPKEGVGRASIPPQMPSGAVNGRVLASDAQHFTQVRPLPRPAIGPIVARREISRSVQHPLRRRFAASFLNFVQHLGQVSGFEQTGRSEPFRNLVGIEVCGHADDRDAGQGGVL